MNYEELVKALRCKRDDCEGCDLAFFDKDEGWMCQYAAKDDDAADAIEDMAKHITEMHERVTVLQIARGKLEEEVDALKHDIARYVQMNTDLLNEPPKVGKAGNQYTLIEPKNKRYTLRCPKCGTVVGLMEVQDGK